MFDARLFPVIEKTLRPLARQFVYAGVSANQITVVGSVFGVTAFLLITQNQMILGLAFILLNRLADGLDGTVARIKGSSDLGGYLDIVIDFIFYASIPLAFAIADPKWALAACFLVTSYIGTTSSFLAHAIITAKHDVELSLPVRKEFYYLGGLTEGFETFTFMVLICCFPNYFSLLAWIFGGMCLITTAIRIIMTANLCRTLQSRSE